MSSNVVGMNKTLMISMIGIKYFAVIFDLDQTIANIDHRLHHVTGPKKNYGKFYNGIPYDRLRKETYKQLLLAAPTNKIIIVTGQPGNARIRKLTEFWLAQHNVPYSEIIYRPAGSYAPQGEYKKEVANRLRQKYTIRAAFDDDPDALRSYSELGIPTYKT